MIKNAVNITDDSEIAKHLIGEWKMDRTRIAGLSKLLDELLKQGDPYARRIVIKRLQSSLI